MTQNTQTNLVETSIEPSPVVAIETSQTPMQEMPKKRVKIKLTGRMLNFTRLHITGDDFEQIKIELNKKFANHPNSNLLTVLSCEEVLDLAALLTHLWGLHLQPIGIVTGKMDEQACEQKLAIFPEDGKRINVLIDDKKVNLAPIATVITSEQAVSTPQTSENAHLKEPNIQKPETKNATPTHTTNDTAESNQTYTSNLPQTSHREGDLVYSTMLRSGQSINHVGGDLILTQGINAGAEAITDYSLHVYGKAEGRLVAGATGDENAKIFCLRFNPSLVSVAGTFCLRENIPNEFLDKAVQVSYERDKGLVFKQMNV